MRLIFKTIFILVVIFFGINCHAYDLIIHEHLGRNWTREFVTFPLTKEQLEKVNEKALLVGSDGAPVPWQLVTDDKGVPRIGLQVDLEKYSTKKWSFSSNESQFQSDSDIKIENTQSKVRISNSHTGIEIPKHPEAGSGPISGIMLSSGKWIADSKLISDSEITRWTVDVTQSGPVMAEIRCVVEFEHNGIWETRYRIYANEPVVLVDENYTVDKKAILDLELGENFHPTELFYRYGKGSTDGSVGENATWTLEEGIIFTMEPWLRWWINKRQGSTFSLYNHKDNDLFTMAAREAGSWVDPEIPETKRSPPFINIIKNSSGVHARFPLTRGQRKWMIGSFDRDQSLSILKMPGKEKTSPIPYQYLSKYGHFPLELVNNYILDWSTTINHPRLLVTDKDIDKFISRKVDRAHHTKVVKAFLNNPRSLGEHSLDSAISAFLITGDADLGKLLADFAMKALQSLVNNFIDQNGFPFGAAPHHQSKIAASVNVADIVMDSEFIDPLVRDTIRSYVAFLAYTISRSEYWSPERGYMANPNMTITVASNQVHLAAFISDHPHADEWIGKAMKVTRKKLDEWADENGGWLEAPHYATLSYDEILSQLVIANNVGANDWLYTEPKVKKVIQWLAKIATPPDSRIGGFRHHPPIGNTYINEPTGEFGLVAYLFSDKDPEFSAEMQWQFNQSNRYKSPGIAGAYPAFSGYRNILINPDLPEKIPLYESEIFHDTGLVLRDAYPSKRETYLHMIQGKNHEHYDFDSGSIIIYGKGRIISDDFGYYGRAPQEDHSLVEFLLGGDGLMEIKDNILDHYFDYVAGVKGPWMRQIIMVKGKTAEEPAYFVINDTLDAASLASWLSLLTAQKAHWRLWLTAQEVKIKQQSVLVVGKEDVDTDIFILSPKSGTPVIEEKTRRSASGMKKDWHWGAVTSTQHGLTLPIDTNAGVSVIVYPRLKGESTPTFIPLASGKGAKIIHSSGIDYVFLSRRPFVFSDSEVHFKGSSGMVQFRHGEIVLAIGSAGTISAGGKYLSSDDFKPH